MTIGVEMPQNGGGKGWVTNPDTGEKIMPELWKSFLEWLLLGPERVPQTQKEWLLLMVCMRIRCGVGSVILGFVRSGRLVLRS